MSLPHVDLVAALESAEVFVDGDWVESKDQDPDGDVRLIQLADVGDGVYVDKSSRFLTAAKARALKCTFLKEGDVLVARKCTRFTTRLWRSNRCGTWCWGRPFRAFLSSQTRRLRSTDLRRRVGRFSRSGRQRVGRSICTGHGSTTPTGTLAAARARK